MGWLTRFRTRASIDRGVTTVEYGIIIAGVGIVAIPGILLLNSSLSSTYQSTTDAEVGVCVGSDCAGAANEVPPPAGFVDTAPGGGLQAQSIVSIAFNPSSGFTQGGPSATVTAVTSSGLTATFTSGTPSVCTVVGGVVSFGGSGTCTIIANQAGNGTYSAASPLSASITVSPPSGPQNQTIDPITFFPSSGFTVQGPTAAVSASATSSLPVTFSSATGTVCTVSGSTVTFLAAGQCTINADQAGSGSWNPAPQVQGTVTVGKGNQTIGAITFNPASGYQVGGATATASATATSGQPVAFSSGTTGICTVSGSTVTFVGAGTCTVRANQGGDANWNAASQVTADVTVAKGDQTISFTQFNLPKNGTTTLVATATSGLTVTFTSSTPSRCTVSGTTLTYVSNGQCRVTASQAGDSNWNVAPTVERTQALN